MCDSRSVATPGRREERHTPPSKRSLAIPSIGPSLRSPHARNPKLPFILLTKQNGFLMPTLQPTLPKLNFVDQTERIPASRTTHLSKTLATSQEKTTSQTCARLPI